MVGRAADGETRPPVGVLALQGGSDVHRRALEEVGAAPVRVRRASELEGLAGLVIPGGESTTLLRFLERDGFLDTVRAFALRRPTFGTCAGCILMARSTSQPEQACLGVLDVVAERNAYGRQNDSSIETGDTNLPGGPMEMVFIRAPRITAAGPEVDVLARRDGAPVLVRQGHLLAATFHPELSADRRVHRLFLDMVAADT